MILRDEDLLIWQGVVRDFLATVEVRDRPPGARIDRELWRRACDQLGVAGLDLPEDLGGAASGFGALAVVLRECGRVLAPLPVLGSVVLGQGLLLAAGDDAALAELLPGLLGGELVLAAVLDAPDLEVVAEGADGRLTGRLGEVVDGMSADLLLVVDGSGRLWLVGPEDDGVDRRTMPSMDLVRDFAVVTLTSAPARRVGDRLAADALARLRRARTAAVACEQHGGAEAVLAATVAYTLDRVQFGRRIGSFQAVKHRCADLAIELDLSLSAVEHAAWAVQEDADVAPLAVAMAGATCGPAYLRCALENVQLHGGIGFTWEHSAHLHVRRAESDLALFGDAERHREAVLESLVPST
ncbi:acyl-CoA dehydrogenase [Nocardioides sp. L-11A]|uniref:acyl-CoA dehydrogenase n=1 Tax=Nocardioides sp. L-11A TaxID=3043848 RepID=UPI002499C2DB|nr:acyl-CoA dehydrogenase [Nocardioides sp. L-11A]